MFRHTDYAWTGVYGRIMKGSTAVMAALGLFWITASAQTLSPTAVLKQRNEALQKLQASMNTPEGEAKVRQAIVNSFDFREHSRISLGKYWTTRTKAEQDEFVKVMREWTENRAIKKLLKRSEKTSYESEEMIGSTKAEVKTVVLYKGTKTYVDYRMKLDDGQWRIYDMVIDGASVALANRDAFYKKIQKTSYEELVSVLRAKALETG